MLKNKLGKYNSVPEYASFTLFDRPGKKILKKYSTSST